MQSFRIEPYEAERRPTLRAARPRYGRVAAVAAASALVIDGLFSPVYACAPPATGGAEASGAAEERSRFVVAADSAPTFVLRGDDPFGWSDAQVVVPVALSVGVALDRWELSGFGQIGAVLTSHDSNVNVTSHRDGYDLRLGLAARRFLAEESASMRPWLGAALGHEHMSMDGGDTRGSGGFVELRVGLDLRLGRGAYVGPYVGGSAILGQYWRHVGSNEDSSAFLAFGMSVGLRATVAP
jgi:hypothetical protein